MLPLILRDDATLILFRRALVMWVLVRVLIFAVVAVGPVKVEPSVPGLIILCTALCIAEWRRRREGAFWRNLGVSLGAMIVIAGAAAITGETFLWGAVRVFAHR